MDRELRQSISAVRVRKCRRLPTTCAKRVIDDLNFMSSGDPKISAAERRSTRRTSRVHSLSRGPRTMDAPNRPALRRAEEIAYSTRSDSAPNPGFGGRRTTSSVWFSSPACKFGENLLVDLLLRYDTKRFQAEWIGRQFAQVSGSTYLIRSMRTRRVYCRQTSLNTNSEVCINTKGSNHAKESNGRQLEDVQDS